MPDSERCQRIGELLGKALVRYFHKQRIDAHAQATAARVKPAAPVDFVELVTDEIEKQIIRHLTLIGYATPLDFSRALGLSPATVFRKLARMRTRGLVLVEGKSRAARYRLAGHGGKN